MTRVTGWRGSRNSDENVSDGCLWCCENVGCPGMRGKSIAGVEESLGDRARFAFRQAAPEDNDGFRSS